MAQTTAHLTDHVVPHLAVRQWVLSVPKRFYRDSPHSQALYWWDWYFLDYGIGHWREVKRPGNEEQTAHLQTGLLH